jgi:hypothetical protein
LQWNCKSEVSFTLRKVKWNANVEFAPLAYRVPYEPRRAGPQSTGGRKSAGGVNRMSLGTILLIILVIFLLGGFSGRFGGYGYGFGHGGIGLIGVLVIVLLVLVLTGRL